MICETTVAMGAVVRACSQRYGFWLDSALVDPQWGRTSLYGEDPFLVLRSKGRTVEVTGQGGSRRIEGSPFEVLRELLREQSLSPEGGAVGYFAYDLKQHVEELPQQAEDDLALPDCYLCFYDRIVRYDARLTAPVPSRNGEKGLPARTSQTCAPRSHRMPIAASSSGRSATYTTATSTR